jgi:hypothetical protein
MPVLFGHALSRHKIKAIERDAIRIAFFVRLKGKDVDGIVFVVVTFVRYRAQDKFVLADGICFILRPPATESL